MQSKSCLNSKFLINTRKNQYKNLHLNHKNRPKDQELVISQQILVKTPKFSKAFKVRFKMVQKAVNNPKSSI